MRVKAYNSERPTAVATATVSITMLRNAEAPVFTESSYQVQIYDNHRLGTAVTSVSATDPDGVSFSYLTFPRIL